MSITTPPFFFNSFTQRMLSQSNNISYALRGVYRVHETEGPRKGDYWFRDFGMSIACAYMTELGFRAADTLNTIPLLTKTLQLHQLSENPLYKNARDYDSLPEIVRQRMMGSLVSKSSTSLVPNLMKELELRQCGELEDIKQHVETMLTSPTENAETIVADFLTKNGLKPHEEDIQRISAIENPTRRADAIAQLKAKNPHLDIKHIGNAVKLEDARQMGILMDHLHRHLNFPEYLEKQYLTEHKLTGIVSDAMKEYTDKLTTMHSKGKTELPALLDDLFKLPISKREEEFTKKFNDVLGSLEFKNGVLLATQDEYSGLQKLGEKIRPLLKEEQPSANSLTAVRKEIETFYAGLVDKQKQPHTHHLDALWEHSHTDLHSRISKKVDDVLTDVSKLAHTGQDRGAAFVKKLNELQLGEFLDDTGKQAFQRMQTNVSDILKPHPSEHVSATTLGDAREVISHFMERHLPKDSLALLRPLIKPEHLSRQSFEGFIRQSLKSQPVASAVSKIQASSTWPKMGATILLNLIFYGFLATNFDNHVLQPFQTKLAKERGSAQEIVTSGYLATLPAALVLSQMFDKVSLPIIRRMGYFKRFAVVGGMALATFAGGTYGILMHRLKQTPAPKSPQPTRLPATTPLYPVTDAALTAPAHAPAFTSSLSPQSPFASRIAIPEGKPNNFAIPRPQTAPSGFVLPNTKPISGFNTGPYAWPTQRSY